MKIKLLAILGLFFLIFGVGCAQRPVRLVYERPFRGPFRGLIPVRPPGGLFYTSYRAPLDIDYKKANLAEREGDKGTKAVFLNNIFSLGWDKAAIKEAAAKAGLKEIYYLDYEYTNIFGLYQTFGVIAYGR